MLVALAVGAAILFLVLSPRGGATEAVQKGQVSALAKDSTATPPAVNNAEAPAPVMGRIAPDFTLETLDGQQVTLSRLRGKPVWINFWATWCPPCQAEMPEMQRKYEALKDKGIIIVGVNFGERIDKVRTFATERKFGWTFGLDDANSIANKYNITGLAPHFFVGTDGTIKTVQLGGLSSEMMDAGLASILK